VVWVKQYKTATVMEQIYCDVFSLSPKRVGLPNVYSIRLAISALSTHLSLNSTEAVSS